jgi:hypothetical protein
VPGWGDDEEGSGTPERALTNANALERHVETLGELPTAGAFDAERTQSLPSRPENHYAILSIGILAKTKQRTDVLPGLYPLPKRLLVNRIRYMRA